MNFNEETIRALIDRVHGEKARLVPDCAVCASACGRTDDYDMEKLWGAQEDIRSLKSLILFGVRGMAAYAHHAMVLGYKFPVGPLALTDIVGLDVRLGIAEYLESTLGERFAPPQLMRDMVTRGELGRKAGKGLYDYN